MAGLLSAFNSLPFDNAKTKMQKMQKNKDGSYPYKNIFDAMLKTVRDEGFTKLWVGLLPFCLRVAPAICIVLVTQDFLTDTVNEFRKGRKNI